MPIHGPADIIPGEIHARQSIIAALRFQIRQVPDTPRRKEIRCGSLAGEVLQNRNYPVLLANFSNKWKKIVWPILWTCQIWFNSASSLLGEANS